MEIVKIDKETWRNAVICQIHQIFLLPMFLLYGTKIGLGSYKQGIFTLDNTYTHVKETCKERVYYVTSNAPIEHTAPSSNRLTKLSKSKTTISFDHLSTKFLCNNKITLVIKSKV